MTPTVDGTLVVALLVAIGLWLHARWAANGLRSVCADQFARLGVKDDKLAENDKTITELRVRLAQSETALEGAIDSVQKLYIENCGWRQADAARRQADAARRQN